jgi:hypothetical protein
MNGWLELEEKRSLFLACLRAARFYPLGVLTLLLFLKAPQANAQQVTPVPPFVGTNSETWEEFPIEKLGSSVISILEGTATISGTKLETDGPRMFFLCYGYVMPSDGVRFLGSNSLYASIPITISFSQPVSAFGAYWGAAPPSCNPVGPTEFNFYDTSGNLVGTSSFPYAPPRSRSLAMDWHGYAFATPVKTITIQGAWVATDGMQVTVASSAARSISNISTRAFVQAGDNVMIGGFIVQGTGPKRVIVRAIGPELTPFGIPNVLADPTLELHNGAGALIASNDNWQSTVIGGIITSNQVSAIQNSGHAPTQPSESAIIATLQPGNYTAIVRGRNNTTGVALVEVYDLNPDTTSVLGNISTRAFVQTGNNVMIGGFIIQGSGQKRVIVRSIGPELTPLGVPNALADPTLELHNGTGALIGSNDNWQTTIIGGIITQDQVQDIQNSGHAPGDASESAIIATLPPGNYTAIARGVSNTVGVALVEVYDLN